MQNQLDYIKSKNPLLIKKIEKISSENNISSNLLLLELIKFLNLVYTTKQQLTPSYLVDLAWHEFILFTRLYHAFCNTFFNKFIHHTPSEKENYLTFQKTIKLYTEHYNKPPEIIWGKNATKEWEANNCGACHN